MSNISYVRHRFPPSIIQRAVWLYFRFPLSFRDVEEMLAERGIDVSYETIRRWILKFGPAIAVKVRSRRVQPSGTWHLDEVFGWINVDSKTGVAKGYYSKPSSSNVSTPVEKRPIGVNPERSAHFHTHPNVGRLNGTTVKTLFGKAKPGFGSLAASPADKHMGSGFGPGFIFGSNRVVKGFVPTD